jgi:hypothetical protein
VRRVLEFEADLPDDQIEVDDEIVQFGGCSATQFLREKLIADGWSADSVEQHSDSVWFFNMTGKLGSVTIYLSDLRPKYVVTLERHSWLGDLLRRSNADFRASLVSLERTVMAVGGRQLTWFKTYDAADSPHLTIDEVMKA